jgi:hypothetical protein
MQADTTQNTLNNQLTTDINTLQTGKQNGINTNNIITP